MKLSENDSKQTTAEEKRDLFVWIFSQEQWKQFEQGPCPRLHPRQNLCWAVDYSQHQVVVTSICCSFPVTCYCQAAADQASPKCQNVAASSWTAVTRSCHLDVVSWSRTPFWAQSQHRLHAVNTGDSLQSNNTTRELINYCDCCTNGKTFFLLFGGCGVEGGRRHRNHVYN